MEKTYKIYHPIDGINTDCKITNSEYQLAGVVKAGSLEQAFIFSQEFSTQWTSKNLRSTSVGDVITDNHKYYMVKNIGFREVNQPILNRITLVKDIS